MTPPMETVHYEQSVAKKFGSLFRQYWCNLHALSHKVLCENVINCAAAEEEERGYEKHRKDERRRIAAEQSLHEPSALGVCVHVYVCV